VTETSAVLIGSAISAIVAMVVVALQSSLERRRQSLADRADRLGDFLSATYAVSSGIEEVAIAAPKSKLHMEADARSAAQDRLNNSLTRLRLFEDADVVTTATYLERELTRINNLARNQQWTRDAWRTQRTELARITHEYETVARQKLRRGQLRNELSFYWTDLPVTQGTESSLCLSSVVLPSDSRVDHIGGDARSSRLQVMHVPWRRHRSAARVRPRL
jgi:hypothetical protein